MVEVEKVLPEFRRRVCPDCKIYAPINGQKGLAGFVLRNSENEFFYLTYVRGPFRMRREQGIDRSILMEANARFKATIVKTYLEDNGQYKFYGCDAKQWYQYVMRNDSWYPAPEESQDLGNIPLNMLRDLESKPADTSDKNKKQGLDNWGLK